MIFKNVDKQFNETGFVKKENNHMFVASYERQVIINDLSAYTQSLDIRMKTFSKYKKRKKITFVMQSYEKGCNSDGFNNVVALDSHELKLISKKMRELKFKYIIYKIDSFIFYSKKDRPQLMNMHW